MSTGQTLSEIESSRSGVVDPISERDAISIAKNQDIYYNKEVQYVSLAYAPTEGGIHALCYEIRFDCGFCYVNVLTGDIISPF